MNENIFLDDAGSNWGIDEIWEGCEPPLIKATNLLWLCGENLRSRIRASSRSDARSERGAVQVTMSGVNALPMRVYEKGVYAY